MDFSLKKEEVVYPNIGDFIMTDSGDLLWLVKNINDNYCYVVNVKNNCIEFSGKISDCLYKYKIDRAIYGKDMIIVEKEK